MHNLGLVAYSGENADSHMCDTNNVVTCKNNEIEMMLNWPASLDTARFCFIYPVNDGKMSQRNYKDKKLCFTYNQTALHSDKQNDVLCEVTAIGNTHKPEINIGDNTGELLTLFHPLSALRVEMISKNELADLKVFQVKKEVGKEELEPSSVIYFKNKNDELPSCFQKAPASMKLFQDNNIKTYGYEEVKKVEGEDGVGDWSIIDKEDEGNDNTLFAITLSDFMITKIELRGVQPQGTFTMRAEGKNSLSENMFSRIKVGNTSGATTTYCLTDDTIPCQSRINQGTDYARVKKEEHTPQQCWDAADSLKRKTLFLIPQPLTDNMELRIYYQYTQTIRGLEMIESGENDDDNSWYNDIESNLAARYVCTIKGAKRISLKKLEKLFEGKNDEYISDSKTHTSNLLPNSMYRISLNHKEEDDSIDKNKLYWTINPDKCKLIKIDSTKK